jgi:hypothetical protein
MTSLQFVVGSDTIDLLAGSDGYTLRLDGWAPRVARKSGGEYEAVEEIITLKATGSSYNNLANIVTTDLEDKIEWIEQRIGDSTTSDADLVLLRMEEPGQMRQALVRKLGYSLGNAPHFPPVTNQFTFLNLTLAVERAPFWEGYTQGTVLVTSVASGGDRQTVSSSLPARGSVPGRIKRFQVIGGTNLSEYWTGFRTNKHGTHSDFQPVWPFDNVTTDNDATASGGTVVWNSADSSLLERFRISMSQVSSIPASTYRSQRGTFAVLLRARSTGTETFNVQLSDGFYTDGTDPKNTHSRVRVSGTSFKFYNVGTVTIPPMALRSTSYDAGMMGNYHLRLAVEVAASGTGNFEATRFVLIPQDEGGLHINGVNTSSVASCIIETSADDRLSAFTLLGTTDTVQRPSALDAPNFTMPHKECSIVFAGHGTTQSLTGYVNISIIYYPRWLGLGGI